MWIIKISLPLILIVGFCSAGPTTSKPKTVNKEKDVKEKRDAASSAPYSYEIPQKPFHIPAHAAQPQPQPQPQPKYTHIEHQPAQIQKVAPLEYKHQKQEVAVVPIQSQYHPTTFHQTVQYAPAQESAIHQGYKSVDDYSFMFPNYESFGQMPIVHYNGDFDKISSSIVNIPGYSFKSLSPMFSGLKSGYSYAMPASYISQSPSYAVPSSSHTYQSYSAPQHSAPQSYASQSYAPQSYAPQSYAPQSYASQSYAPAHYVHSYPSASSSHQHTPSHVPAAVYVQQTLVPKLTKIPEYATGSKGLGQFSNVAVAPINVHPTKAYVQTTYESPVNTQTERPFKPSAFLGASHVNSVESYVDSSVKPLSHAEYAAPAKAYLPAKEPEQYHHGQQVEYQIQYVQQPQSVKNHSPVSSYLPPKAVLTTHEISQNTYIPPTVAQPVAPIKNYLPPVAEKPGSSYLPAKSSYPSSESHHYHHHTAPSSQSGGVAHQYQSHEAYESTEYQSVSQSGHK